MSSSSTISHPLPLSSFLTSHAPQHPLARIFTDPILPRLAAAEATLLLSRPSALLLRLGLASERGLGAVALAAVVSALVTYRQQWRAVAWVLGVGEALKRTVDTLRKSQGRAGKRYKDVASGLDAKEESEEDEETQHILSWWLLFALLSLFDTLRTSPSFSSCPAPSVFNLPTQLRTAFNTLRHTYLRFLRFFVLPQLLRSRNAARQLAKRYPSLDLSPLLSKLPSLALPFVRPRPRVLPHPRPARPSFPQPRLASRSSTISSIPLSWSYFLPRPFFSIATSATKAADLAATAEKRWELVKLLLLWLGLRKDGWGARSVVWDWVLKPLVDTSAAVHGGKEEWRVVRGPASGDTKDTINQQTPSRPAAPHSPDPFSSTPAPPPSLYTWTPPSRRTTSHSTAASTTTITRRQPRSPSPTPSAAPFAFPTPVNSHPSPPPSSTRSTQRTIPLSLTIPPPSLPKGFPSTVSPSFAATETSNSRTEPRSRSRTNASAPESSSTCSSSKTELSGRSRTSSLLLLDESPPRSLRVDTRTRSGSRSRLVGGTQGKSDHEDGVEEEKEEEEGEEGEEVPQTPGQEEAEEGLRGWGSLLPSPPSKRWGSIRVDGEVSGEGVA
ncbi:hypothetical protein JCM11641_000646 [Rhodosporidiobolus odoratus]